MSVSALAKPAVLLASILASLALAAPAAAMPALNFSAPAQMDAGGTPSALSCPSESLCVAVDRQGNALTSSDPAAATPGWSTVAIDAGEAPLNAVSCAPGAFCLAVDAHGNAFSSTSPASGPWSRTHIKGAGSLSGVACPSSSLCVAADEAGNLWTSTTPASGGWSEASFGAGHRWRAVSCSAAPVCAAVDEAGEVITSTDPGGGRGAWHEQKVDVSEPLAVSCASLPSASSSVCALVDKAGRVLASADAGAPAPSWTLTGLAAGELDGASCASSGLCAAVGRDGEMLASDDAPGPTPAWASYSPDAGRSLVAVSCQPGGFCLALDSSGNSVSGRVGPPTVTTLRPSQVTVTAATLAGAVDPNDAVLGACTFEYGIALPYSQAIPCSLLPVTIGETREVSALLTGLAPNTTYHYRLAAASPAGEAAGADESFTTATSSQIPLVRPNPSISGTPAVGQRLTCHANTPAGSVVQLAYAWLRDQIPIPGATASTYTVKGQDSGHHLQCEVTATDGGGSVAVKSAFVTIPAGAAPVSAGETQVGRATARGTRVSVPVSCSRQAQSGCSVTLRLAVVETLSGRRVIALAARAPAGARARSHTAGVRRTTVTIASAHAHLSAGAGATLTATLNSTGRHLLASHRSFGSSLYVTGTVIGVIQAQLADQLLTLKAASAHAARHGSPRH